MWARLDGKRVAEITDIDPAGRFHPSIEWVSVPENTKPGMIKKGNNYEWPEPEPEPIPASVSRRQAKQALILAGLYDQVQPAIDAIEDAQERLIMQVFWDDSITFERENPQLKGMALALNLSDEQLDDLFVQAANL